MSDLHGRVAIVTGASRGIGRSIALELGRRGAVVVVADVLGEQAAGVAAEIAAAGGEAEAAAVSVTDQSAVEGLVQDGIPAQVALQHGTRRLAGAKAGHPRLRHEVAISAIESLFDPLGLYLYLQDYLAFGELLSGNPHGPSGHLQVNYTQGSNRAIGCLPRGELLMIGRTSTPA